MDYAQIYPFLGITARGKIGNLWIHKLYKERFWNNHPEYPQNPDRYKMVGSQGRVITKYYYPENPRTAKQQGNRSTFSDGLYNWSQFDKNTKNYYDELKRPIYAYGIHRYISLYMLANPNMIIYWNTLEKSATDPARLPDYMSSEYFGGINRVGSFTTYPATSPYGSLRYRSDLNKFVGFKKDSGWGEIGAAVSGDGWNALGECTYEGADAPTYTFSIAADMTTILSSGMRIKLTDTTVNYFIITAVGAFSGGKTILTVYGGTDYTLTGGDITLPYYSTQKAPYGFTIDPIKWTVAVTDSTVRSQVSPTPGTIYNLGSISINVPIGIWNFGVYAVFHMRFTGAAGEAFIGLSTATDSYTDSELKAGIFGGYNAVANVGSTINMNKVLELTEKDTYYLIEDTPVSMDAFYLRSDVGKTYIRAVCAYL